MSDIIIIVTKEKDCHNLFSQIPLFYSLYNMHPYVPNAFKDSHVTY